MRLSFPPRPQADRTAIGSIVVMPVTRNLDDPERAQVAALGAAVRTARKRLDMSIAELATAAGVSLGLISQLERGMGNPALGTIQRLAAALAVPTSQLLEEPSTELSVIRAEPGQPLPDDPEIPPHQRVERQLLSPRGESVIQLIRSIIPVGFTNAERPFRHIGTESVTVLSGRLLVVHGDRRVILEQGDSATYGCSRPHWWANEHDGPTVVLGAVTPFER